MQQKGAGGRIRTSHVDSWGWTDQVASCDLFDWGSFPSLARSNAAPHRTLLFVLIFPKTLDVFTSLLRGLRSHVGLWAEALTAGFDSTQVVTEFFIGLASKFVVAARLAFPTPPIVIHIEAQKATFTPKMYCSSLSFLPAAIGAPSSSVFGKVFSDRR
jgi:hypothetical protein